MSDTSTVRPAAGGRLVGLAGAVVALGVVAALGLCVGARSVPLSEVVTAFTAYAGTDDHVVVRELRLPRVWLACAVGAALAVSGALVQTMTRNPLAEPGILGVTAGASFAIVLGTAWWGLDGQAATLLTAAVGAVVATASVYAVGRESPLRLLLAGVALSAVLAGLGLAIRLTRPEVFDSYRYWSVGSLAGREQAPLELPLAMIGLGLVGAVLLVPSLSAVALGEAVATTLGTRVRTTRILTLLVVTLLAAAATAVAGPIAFVGLIVPHLVRRAAAGSIGWLVTLSILGGPVLVLAADVLARVLLTTGEVPVATVTAFLGGPVLIWVVRRYGTVAL